MKGLVIEDKPQEQAYAAKALQAKGITDVDYVSTLHEAFEKLRENDYSNGYDFVLTDLFFPVGDYGREERVKETYLAGLGAYRADMQGHVLDMQRRGMSTQYGMDNIEKIDSLVDKVNSGGELPSGIFITRCTKGHKIPTMVVTDTYHHDVAYSCIKDKVGADYTDSVVTTEGARHKNWEHGLEQVLDIVEKGESRFWRSE